jgi:general secretion pathway protein L
MSSLYLLLPTQPASPQTEFDYVLTPDGRAVGRHASAPAALLPQPGGAGSEVVAIVPAAALSWHQVELPKGTTARSPRLRNVLEGLLEDKLLDDPDALHFALQPSAPNGGAAWVAVCDRAWLRAALQVLEGAGRPVGRVVPEFAPEGETALFVLGEPENARLVCAGPDGVLLLPLTATSLALLPSLPQDTPVIAEPAVAAQAEQLLRLPTLMQPAERRLQAGRTTWDLAQGEFASSSRTRAFKKFSTGWGDLLRAPQWRAARWGAVVLVVAQLVGLNAWAWKERSALAAKRDGARSILAQTFPNVRVIVDAPVQMEREVATLRQAAGGTSGRDLETMLGALATVVPPGRGATALDYTGSELRIRGLAGSAAEAQPLQASLRSQGYAATVQGDQLVLRPETAP